MNMATEWRQAPQMVIDIAERIIAEYHPDLLDARIGFLLRSGSGMVVYGKAKKVSEELKTVLPYDFIIWLAEDMLGRFSAIQREALIDHELSHCLWNEEKRAAKMRPHDLEEFNHIIERYGLWWPASDATALAIQPHLPLERERRGKVSAVEMDEILTGVKNCMEAAFDDVEVILPERMRE
jgi:hypothetical protein